MATTLRLQHRKDEVQALTQDGTGGTEKGLIVGIDASRNRSGGAKGHLIGVISEARPADYGIAQVHVWSYKSLLDTLPERHWLKRHCPKVLERNLFWQVLWQRFVFPIRARQLGCDVVLNADAGTVAAFRPSITMSRDALSYEPGEMQRYGYSTPALRLLLLRYLQNRSLKSSDGCIFLTEYISRLIQESAGELPRARVIPHGIDPDFRRITDRKVWPNNANEPIKLVYVSNVALYKHQWHVVKAVSILRKKGYNVRLILAGAMDGWRAQRLLDEAIECYDPNRSMIEVLGPVPPNRLPALLADSHIFVFASSCETISITLLEGMASGLPIACSNRGPLPEVLRDGGVYFDPEDAASIAGAFEHLIDNPQIRDTISKRSRERSASYSWDRCASHTFEFLAEIANECGAASC